MRTFTRTAFAAVAAGFVGLTLSLPAHALTITQVQTYGPAATDWANATAGFVNISKFDSSLGTLNRVTIDITEHVTGTITLTPSTGSVTVSSLDADTQVAVIDPFAPGVGCTNDLSGACSTIAGAVATIANLSAVTVSTPQVFSTIDVTGNSGSALSLSSPFLYKGFDASAANPTGCYECNMPVSTYLADFTGSGSFSLFLATNTTTIGDGSGSFTLSQTTNDTATVTVVYTYDAVDAVPEPASIAIIGTGLAGIGWMRRRRAAR